MKLGKRLKKALFAFFKDEILQAVKANIHPISHHQIIAHQMEILEIKSSIVLSDDKHNNGNLDKYSIPIALKYDRALQECKARLFEEVMNHAKIDERNLLDRNIYDTLSIDVSLYIGIPT